MLKKRPFVEPEIKMLDRIDFQLISLQQLEGSTVYEFATHDHDLNRVTFAFILKNGLVVETQINAPSPGTAMQKALEFVERNEEARQLFDEAPELPLHVPHVQRDSATTR